MSYSVAKISLPPGALVARLESPPMTPANSAYSSVQVSKDQHIELNCDFLYVNHSCEPSLEFHIVTAEPISGSSEALPFAIEIRVAARKAPDGKVTGLNEGDEMTFFYPSTEWDMTQAFECQCKKKTCKGKISGAKHMPKERLEGLFINKHIEELLAGENANGTNGTSGTD